MDEPIRLCEGPLFPLYVEGKPAITASFLWRGLQWAFVTWPDEERVFHLRTLPFQEWPDGQEPDPEEAHWSFYKTEDGWRPLHPQRFYQLALQLDPIEHLRPQHELLQFMHWLDTWALDRATWPKRFMRSRASLTAASPWVRAYSPQRLDQMKVAFRVVRLGRLQAIFMHQVKEEGYQAWLAFKLWDPLANLYMTPIDRSILTPEGLTPRGVMPPWGWDEAAQEEVFSFIEENIAADTLELVMDSLDWPERMEEWLLTSPLW